ncbi:hypothetical protein PINS_up000299 [Pythium insidiosum]|nr:hypothetical protein PINS_up000299 [Pythium insidiosum]
MADSTVAELDALLADVVANAERVRDAEDPANVLQQLLEPLRTFVLHVLAAHDASKTSDPARLRAQQYWSEAATKIQALVRGKHQRGQLHRQMSFHLQGTKVLRKYVLKKDRFPQCHVLDTPDGEHAPNFRRLDGTPLYGSAQPTVEGVKHILSRVQADGFTKVVWVNLREEAVIYVDGTPFTARRSAKLNENDLVPGITGHTVQVLESSLKSSLQEQLVNANGVFEYWHEVALHENELVSTRVDPSAVKTLPEIYDDASISAAVPGIASIRYIRIPIERENAPEHADVEKLMELIHSAAPIVRNATSDTAFVFNCQMGKRRTTTALVLSCLIWQRPTMSLESAAMQHLRLAPPSNRRDGSFAAIRELEKELPYGREAKRWVDAAIDQCAAICNIRSVIHEYHELSNSEAKPTKRSYYLHHALSFLERYFYLIVFAAYMLAYQIQLEQQHQAHHESEAKQTSRTLVSFSKWLQHHHKLFRLLDNLGGVKYNSQKALQNAVFKFDHFPGIARIPFELTANVPNYRQIAKEPIFGTAQCLEEGIKDVALHAMAMGFDRAIWINLREEAVIYASGRPFVMRNADNLLANVEYPGIEVDEILEIEQQVKEEVQARVRRSNGLFMYWHEPREFVSEEKIEHINADLEIKTLHEIYAEVASETGFDLRYARIPVSDETAPEEKDLDDMVRLVAPVFIEELGLEERTKAPKRTAVICNCQMGRGRTTTALVCVYLLRLVLEDERIKRFGDNDALDASVLRRVLHPHESQHELRRQSSFSAGEFVVIRKLCNRLSNGHEAKVLVDYAVDKCEHLQNLRDCIAQCRDLAVDRDLPTNKHDAYMLRAVNYLERYFYLICFAAYLLEERASLFQHKLFVTWMNERYGSELYELLDNLCFEEEVGAEIHLSSMRWRWRRKRKLVSRLE